MTKRRMNTTDLNSMARTAKWPATRDALLAHAKPSKAKVPTRSIVLQQSPDAPPVDVELPITLASVQNEREHWGQRHKRNKQQSGLLRAMLNGVRLPALPAMATFTRVAPAQYQLDDDNCTASFKALRDQLARLYGVDDRDARLRFVCGQAVGKYAVRVSVRSATGEVRP